MMETLPSGQKQRVIQQLIPLLPKPAGWFIQVTRETIRLVLSSQQRTLNNTILTAAIDGDVVTLSGFTSTTYDNKNAATGKTYNLYKITIINILLSYRPAK